MGSSFEASSMAAAISSLDPEEFRRQGHLVVDFLADYYNTIVDHPVRSTVEPGYLRQCLPKSAPFEPDPIEEILLDVRRHVIPGLTHWQSPNFFAYFQCNASIAGVLGEMLSSGFGVVGFSWVASPAATELESLVMDWLGDMLKLPTTFLFSGGGGGVMHGSTTESIICTLAAARDKALTKGKLAKDNEYANSLTNSDISLSNLVVYGSDQTHCSFRKASQIVGISPNNIRELTTTEKTRFGMCPNELRKNILKDIEMGLVPIYLCATVGTTSTCAIDPIAQLCEVANVHDIWVHVDAAYAGAACICPEFRDLIEGVELADSFSMGAHKWLLTGVDCCCLWVKDPVSLSQAMSTDAAYLKNKASELNQVVDYKDWQISLTKRFRALKLWMVVRTHGVVNLRRHVMNHVRLAEVFEGLVREDERFELVGRRLLALVCFRISPLAVATKLMGSSFSEELVNEVNAKVMERVNSSGRVFMTHTVVGGVYAIRVAVGSTLVEEKHVVMAWKLVQQHADNVLSTLYDNKSLSK